MNLLPIRTVALASELSPADLADSLRGAVGDDPAAPFAGSVAADHFVIDHVREFRSTFMPLARGDIAATAGGGCQVRLRLRPHSIVFVFMSIWLGFLASVAGVIAVAHARDSGRSLVPLLAPIGLAGFSWWLTCSVFAAEARWTLECLLERVPALRRHVRVGGTIRDTASSMVGTGK